MTGFLLDSHIWFWYLTGSERLPAGIRTILDKQGDCCWLSPISVWEIGLLAARGRIDLVGDFHDWASRALAGFPLKDARLNREVALTAHKIELAHRDPADYFLAATALVYDLTLLTVDHRLTEASWLPTRAE